jgi:hypothetical protein
VRTSLWSASQRFCTGDPKDRESGPGRNQAFVQLCACPFPAFGRSLDPSSCWLLPALLSHRDKAPWKGRQILGIEGNKDCVALEPERRRSVPLCAPPHNRGKPRQFTYIATRYPVSGPKSRRIFTFRWSEAEPQTARMRPSTETAADASRLMSVPKKRSAAPLELFPMVLVSGVPVTPELQLRLPPGCL